MSKLQEHAKIELNRIGLSEKSEDAIDRLMYQNIMAIVTMFSGQGHSGGTAAYAISILSMLMNFEPLAPLLGTDEEWEDVSEILGRKAWQNKRCSRILKEEDGKCYDLEGKVFVDPDDGKWTNRESWTEIDFPYIPKHEFVERERGEKE